MTKIQLIRNLIKEKPYLAWDVNDYNNLSPKSVFEHILNYGDWQDFIKLEKIIGLKEADDLFNELKNNKRSNLRPQTINYFTNYFARYA